MVDGVDVAKFVPDGSGTVLLFVTVAVVEPIIYFGPVWSRDVCSVADVQHFFGGGDPNNSTVTSSLRCGLLTDFSDRLFAVRYDLVIPVVVLGQCSVGNRNGMATAN